MGSEGKERTREEILAIDKEIAGLPLVSLSTTIFPPRPMIHDSLLRPIAFSLYKLYVSYPLSVMLPWASHTTQKNIQSAASKTTKPSRAVS